MKKLVNKTVKGNKIKGGAFGKGTRPATTVTAAKPELL